MSKVTMPDPVAKVQTKFGTSSITVVNNPSVKKGDCVYTESQLESYAQARVNEALEAVAKMAMDMGTDTTPAWIAAAIRALKTKEQP